MTAAKQAFRVDIQGLRAVAVGAVVLYHAKVPFLTGGYVGVDIFFVISGFLITGHLLRSLETEGRISFADFYARRARRILPASFVVLVLTVIGSLVWLPPLQLKSMLQGAIATALYVPNYLFAVTGTSYLSETTPSLFQHYWSLGVEEQFYLIWPAILLVGFLAVRRSRRALFIAVATVVVLSFVACVVVTKTDQPWAFFSLPTRAWELGVGGLVAFLLSATVVQRRWPLSVLGVLGWIGLAGLIVIVLTFDEKTAFPGFNAALPVVATASVIISGATGVRTGPRALLGVRPLVFIGAISYSLYLVHWPALLLTQAALGDRDLLPLWGTVGIAVLCVPIAWLLYRFVENPFRNQRVLVKAPARRTLVLTVAASAVIAVVCAGGIAVVSRIPLSTTQSAPEYTPTVQPEGTDFVPDNLEPALRDASDDNPVISDNGCHLDFEDTDPSGCSVGDAGATSVVLFGDSHASQWYPPLAELADAGEIRLDTNTKSACSSVTVHSLRDSEPYPECDAWRQAVIDRLNANPPDVVVLANYAREIDAAHGSEDFDDYWADGLRTTIAALPNSSRVIVVGETATMGITPSLCLSDHLDDAEYCGRPPAAAIDQGAVDVEREVAADTGSLWLDMNPYLCSSQWCPPIIDDRLVYRDAHHLTASFTASLDDVLWQSIEKAIT